MSGNEASLNKFEDINEYTLTFLRPAPPKMSLKPSFIRQHLFPEYRSLAPPVVPPKLTKNPDSFGQGDSNGVRFYKKSTLDLLVDDEDDFDDESQLADELVLQRILTRQYNSETDLRRFDENYDTGYHESNLGIFRSFSDSRLERKPKNGHMDGEDEGIGEDHEFLKIDSNYHHAIEEVKLIKIDNLKNILEITCL